MLKEEVVEGLQHRIDWMVENNRPSAEIGKTIELVLQTAQEFFNEQQTDLFYQKLAEEIKKSGQRPIKPSE